jgi:hypothetical protein
MYGHVKYLLGKADYIFLPVYLEEKKKGNMRRQYCYYTQYTPSLIASIKELSGNGKILMPVLKIVSDTIFHAKKQLYKTLNSIPGIEWLLLCLAPLF